MEEKDWNAFTQAIEKLATLPIYMSDASHWTTLAMKADLSRLKELYGITWFIVDYLDLFADNPGRDNNERTAFISKQVHGMCKDLDLALSIRQNDPVTGMPMKGKGESAPDHFTDPMEYACAYCAAWLPELKDLYKVVLGRRIEQRKAAGMMGEDEDSYKEFQIEKSLNQARDMEEE
jgi:hypothetical protein